MKDSVNSKLKAGVVIQSSCPPGVSPSAALFHKQEAPTLPSTWSSSEEPTPCPQLCACHIAVLYSGVLLFSLSLLWDMLLCPDFRTQHTGSSWKAGPLSRLSDQVPQTQPRLSPGLLRKGMQYFGFEDLLASTRQLLFMSWLTAPYLGGFAQKRWIE